MRAGEMTGRVEASSRLVQTFAHLTFYLRPTLDLEAGS